MAYTQRDLDAAAQLMDDDLREDIHLHFKDRDDPDAFLREYIRRHRDRFGETFTWH